MLVKIYGPSEGSTPTETRYSPPSCKGTKRAVIFPTPTTSARYVERQNLTMRMSMRRFTRLTNAFSKKLDARAALHALQLRAHQSLRVTPAMEAGVTDRLWENDIVEMVDLLPRSRAHTRKEIQTEPLPGIRIAACLLLFLGVASATLAA